MRLRDLLICLVCIVLAIALLIIAGTQLDFINSQRYQMKLIINKPLENAPPSLAFATVAMGAFRGLVVDILWLRADRLKEEGQFFDAKQLAEWITALQPRFGAVWEFQAWNMAYNISAAIPATQPEERWRWVRNGYELLRDKGIPLNPKNILLYRELARIFQHKMGWITDDAHKYYKLQLALAMEPLLGPADNRYFDALVKAPREWQQIIKDAEAARLIAALKSADRAFVDDERFVGNYLSLRQSPGKFAPAAFSVIDNFRGTDALEKFDIFAKAYYLRNVWKLDPALMQELNKNYGPVDWNDPNTHLPLDWRHPDSHAIYWAVKGLQVAGTGTYSMDEANTDRIIGHSFQGLFRNGKIFIYDISPQDASDTASAFSAEEAAKTGTAAQSPTLRSYGDGTTKEIFLCPDLRMFEPYNRAVLATLEKYKDISERTYVAMQNGHRSVLKNAVLLFYQGGHIAQAQKIYDELGKLYPLDDLKVPLVVFVRNQFRGELETIGYSDAGEMIQALLMESYFRYALRDDDEAFGREKMAKEVYDHYESSYSDEDRIGLPDFKLLRYFALSNFLSDQQYPLTLRRNLFGRIKIERPQLAEQLKQQEEMLLKQAEKSQ